MKDDWKLIHFIEPDTYELYNLRRDPYEKQNLFHSENQRGASLMALLKTHLNETRAQIMHSNPAWEKSAPKGSSRNFGVFYSVSGNGKPRQPVSSAYPSWFEHRK